MKYIDAESLRKEVKRLEKTAHKFALCCADSETRKFHEGKDFAYQHIGSLIDSLQQEQPYVDIREEIKKLDIMGSNDARDILHVAEHFYELGLKAHAKTLLALAKKELPMPEDTVIFHKGVEEGRRLEREERCTGITIKKETR